MGQIAQYQNKHEDMAGSKGATGWNNGTKFISGRDGLINPKNCCKTVPRMKYKTYKIWC
jgi:hypothetical protein